MSVNQRLYLTTNDVPFSIPFDAFWTQTSEAESHELVIVAGSSAFVPVVATFSLPASPPTNPKWYIEDLLLGQFVTKPMRANHGVGSGNSVSLSVSVRVQMNDDPYPLPNSWLANHQLVVRVYIFDPFDNSLTLLRSQAYWPIMAISDLYRRGGGMTLPAPFILPEDGSVVLEVGSHLYAYSGYWSIPLNPFDSTAKAEFGDSAADDLSTSNSDHTQKNPWMQISGLVSALIPSSQPLPSPLLARRVGRFHKPLAPTRLALHMQHPKLPPTGDFFGEEILG